MIGEVSIKGKISINRNVCTFITVSIVVHSPLPATDTVLMEKGAGRMYD